MNTTKASNPIEKTCPICGKSYFVSSYGYQKKTCSTACSRVLRKQHAEETSLQKYGVKNAGGTKESLEKVKATNLKKYGTEAYFSSDIAKERNKKIWQEKYGVDNPQKSKKIQEKTKETNLERYGDTNPLGKKSWKREEIDEQNLEKYGVANLGGTEESKAKIKQTHFEHYGTWYSKSAEGRKRIEETNIERYGVKSPFSSPEIQEKIRETNIKKYGVSHAMQSDEVKRSIKERYGSKFGYGSDRARSSIKRTLHEKYGVENISQVPEIQEKIKRTNEIKYGKSAYTQSTDYRKKTNNTCIEKYGVPWPCMTESCREASPQTISKINKAFGNELSKNCINFDFEHSIDSYSYDFILPESNLLVEIDPTYTHSLYGDTIFSHVDVNYHLLKSRVAEEHGLRCVHIFDWDNWTKVLHLLNSTTTKIGARKCEIHEIDKKLASQFLNSYHLQNSCKGMSISYGLFYKNELVEVAAFGKLRYNKNYEYELLRLCARPEFQVYGGAQKIVSHFKDEYSPKSIISYCDKSKFTGHVYSLLKFKLKESQNPSIHWSKPGTKLHYTDNLVRQLGADKLLGTDFGKGSDNKQILLDNGFLPIADCGQDTYTWEAD